MLKIFEKIFGTKSERDIKSILPIVRKIHEEHEKIQKLSNDELRKQTLIFRQEIKSAIKEEDDELLSLRNKVENEPDMPVEEKEKIFKRIEKLEQIIYEKTQKKLDEILPRAFAVVKETARRFKENEVIEVTATDFDRELAVKKGYITIEGDKAYWKNSWRAGGNIITWDMVHFDVQLMGGIVLHQGKIAEMATGEGKTLVATLPLYLNALPGKGVHLVTVNDYLAKRDAEWMGPIYEFLLLTVDCIDKYEPHSEERKKAYLSDITYGTNSEFGFDYLRDNMSRSLDEIVQRGHNYAIVDEVDSVLIDDARTPLIISGPTEKSKDEHEKYYQLKPYVEYLIEAQKKLVNKWLTEARNILSKPNRSDEEEKEAGIALFRCYRALPKYKPFIKFESEPGVKVLRQKTENYYLADNMKNMPFIDQELYFVIDEKNNTIDLTDKGIEYLTQKTGDPQFFILPDLGAQLAELEQANLSKEEYLAKKQEIIQNYTLKAERIHTMTTLMKAYTLFEKDNEYVVMDGKIKIVDEQTGRIMEGRRYSDGIHQAIEAKENVKVEGSTQTYATITLQNYFRMYKKLAGMTGTAETEATEFWNIYKLDVVVIPTNKPVIRIDYPDLIYRTKREKFNAVIEEIVKLRNAGRPVLVGTTSVETSELLSRMLTLRKIPHNVLNAKHHAKEAEIVAKAGLSGTVTIATNMAGRGTDIKLGPGVKEAGGLAIIGTERHEARRIDRQLRGRSGRQGDPGTSQFYVSLEDDLMRLFGSDRIAKIMDRLGFKEGEVIQHSMITSAIERAQRKVEENNFGIRKRLLEYDDVMNVQREVIYSKRRNALYGDKLSIDLINMFKDLSFYVTESAYESRNFNQYYEDVITIFGIEPPFDEKNFFHQSSSEIAEQTFQLAYSNYIAKCNLLTQKTYPIIKDIYEHAAKRYENIAVPFTNGLKTFTAIANLEKSYRTKGREIISSIERGVTLAIIDEAWMEHLRELDDLKTSVQNAVYEQKDPLLIYKFEASELFNQLLIRINRETISFLCQGRIPLQEDQLDRVEEPRKHEKKKLTTGRSDRIPGVPQYHDPSTPKTSQTVHVEKKIGRNDPCYCGSGKKYKHCHGKNA
ncbi:MAG: preprotein translocase subunit SecA [Bacteroidales bacterium]|nr:preprotein translocase subunit SecA [Bacteroidales bacterium]